MNAHNFLNEILGILLRTIARASRAEKVRKSKVASRGRALSRDNRPDKADGVLNPGPRKRSFANYGVFRTCSKIADAMKLYQKDRFSTAMEPPTQ